MNKDTHNGQTGPDQPIEPEKAQGVKQEYWDEGPIFGDAGEQEERRRESLDRRRERAGL